MYVLRLCCFVFLSLLVKGGEEKLIMLPLCPKNRHTPCFGTSGTCVFQKERRQNCQVVAKEQAHAKAITP